MIPRIRCTRSLQTPALRSLSHRSLIKVDRTNPYAEQSARSMKTLNRRSQRTHTYDVKSQPRRWASSSSTTTTTLKTLPLDSFHKSHGAKMVEFAEHSMPLVYSDQTHLESHHWTRNKASLFDVGHMLQHTFSGPLAESFLHKLTPSYLPTLAPLQSTLSFLLHPETGGIVDDAMITRMDRPETFRLVTNGATASKVSDYIQSAISSVDNTKLTWATIHSHNSGLLALQGPLSASILSKLLSPLDAKKLKSLYFGQSSYFSLTGLSGAPILVSRGGYTGEDGFELATSSPEQTVALAEKLFSVGGNGDNLRLAGLGARDSLRLEAGMCLYGHDLDDSTTPAEAALGWVVAKERRSAASTASSSTTNNHQNNKEQQETLPAFNGAAKILAQLTKKSSGGTGLTRKRIGLTITSVPAREGAKIYSSESTSEKDGEGQQIGIITSGAPSPTLGKNIAMGYIQAPGFVKVGTKVKVAVRGKLRDAVVAKMPFVEARYFREIVTGTGTDGDGDGKVEKIKVEESSAVGAAPM